METGAAKTTFANLVLFKVRRLRGVRRRFSQSAVLPMNRLNQCNARLVEVGQCKYHGRCNKPSLTSENAEAKRQCGGAELFVESGERYLAPVR